MSIKIPAVSVLIPVYNRQELVADAIRSVQEQTFEDWELIILDDASTDDTEAVCRSFAVHDKRIKIHNNPGNLGVGESRNRLLSLGTSELLAFQDSDDVSIPERLAVEVEFLKSHPEVGLVSGVAALVDDSGFVLRYYPERLHSGVLYPQDRKEMVECLFLGECGIANPTCMFRRSVIANFSKPFGNFRLAEDRYFFLQVAHVALIWGIPEVLVNMRRGQNHQHVWKDTLTGIREARRALDAFYRQHKNQGDSCISRAIYNRALSASMLHEARYFGGMHGWPQLLKALAYTPLNQHAWSTMLEFSGRGLKKLASGQLFRN